MHVWYQDMTDDNLTVIGRLCAENTCLMTPASSLCATAGTAGCAGQRSLGNSQPDDLNRSPAAATGNNELCCTVDVTPSCMPSPRHPRGSFTRAVLGRKVFASLPAHNACHRESARSAADTGVSIFCAAQSRLSASACRVEFRVFEPPTERLTCRGLGAWAACRRRGAIVTSIALTASFEKVGCCAKKMDFASHRRPQKTLVQRQHICGPIGNM